MKNLRASTFSSFFLYFLLSDIIPYLFDRGLCWAFADVRQPLPRIRLLRYRVRKTGMSRVGGVGVRGSVTVVYFAAKNKNVCAYLLQGAWYLISSQLFACSVSILCIFLRCLAFFVYSEADFFRLFVK